MTGTNGRRINPGCQRANGLAKVAYNDRHIDRANSRVVFWRLLRLVVQHLSSASRTYSASRRLKPEPQPPCRRLRHLRRAPEMKARPRSQRHKLKQTLWRLHLPYRLARRTPMSPCPSSTLPALSERVMRSSPAGLRRARLWNCCATASAMIERSQINQDNSSWFLPGFLLGTTS